MEQTQQLSNESLKQAKEEIEAVCQKHNIILMPITVHRGNETFSSIDLVPRSALRSQQQPADGQVVSE
jgi:aspartate carbamoyltransferase catalytic subunit